MAPRARGRSEEGNGHASVAQPSTSIVVVPKNKSIRRQRDSSTDGIMSSVCEMLRGGKNTLMELAHYAPEIEPGLAGIVEDWDKLTPRGRRTVSLDLLCRNRGVDPFHFLGVVGEAAAKFGNNASVLVAAMSFPKVVETSVKRALKDDGMVGFKYAESLMKHAGFLPVPAGATFVNANQQKVEVNVGPEVGNIRLPSFEETIKNI